MASHHTSSQAPRQPTNAVIHSMPLLSPSYTPRMPLVLEIRGGYEGLRRGIAVVYEWILIRTGAWAAILIMGKSQGKPLKRLDRSGGVVHPTEVGC